MDRSLLQSHADAWGRYVASVKKWAPWMLAFWFVLLLTMTLSVLWGERRAIDSVRGLFQSPDSALTYAQLRSWIALSAWLVGLLTLAISFAWGWFSFGVYLLSEVASDLMIERIVPQDPKHSRRVRSYSKLLYTTVGRRVQMVSYGLIFLISIAFVRAQVGNLALGQTVGVFVLAIVLAAPVVFLAEWYQYLRIRATRSLEMRAPMDDYLFSGQALLAQLKGSIRFGFFLAVIGWVLIPGFIVTLRMIDETGARIVRENANYSEAWSGLVADGFPAHIEILGPTVDLPVPDDLDSYLSWVPPLHEEFDAGTITERFQKGMFVLFAIVITLSVGIPTTLGAVLVPVRRQAIRSALVSVIGSAGLFAGLGIFFRAAFFQDTTNSFGLAAIVMLFVHYVLALRQRE